MARHSSITTARWRFLTAQAAGQGWALTSMRHSTTTSCRQTPALVMNLLCLDPDSHPACSCRSRTTAWPAMRAANSWGGKTGSCEAGVEEWNSKPTRVLRTTLISQHLNNLLTFQPSPQTTHSIISFNQSVILHAIHISHFCRIWLCKTRTHCNSTHVSSHVSLSLRYINMLISYFLIRRINHPHI